MLLTRLLSVLFFLQLIGLSDALFLLNRLFGFLADVLPDLKPFTLLLLMPMAVLLRLDLKQFTVLRYVSFLVPLDLLLPLESLLVQVHLEGLLKVSLLGKLIQPHLFLEFILVAQYGTPFVEHLFL